MQSKKILTAVDQQPGTSRVLQSAIEMASRAGASLICLSVVEPPNLPMPALPIMPSIGPDLEVQMGQLRTLATDALAEFRRENPTSVAPEIEVHVAVGSPVSEIVWLAAHFNVEAIVVGSHGRRGLKRLLLGSVAEKIVRLAGCPVTVVREKNHNPEWKLPEIEPICPDCAKVRDSTAGQTLWCQRHSEHHMRAHAYAYGRDGEESPHAFSSSTGT